jgi:hypothetical protein
MAHRLPLPASLLGAALVIVPALGTPSTRAARLSSTPADTLIVAYA